MVCIVNHHCLAKSARNMTCQNSMCDHMCCMLHNVYCLSYVFISTAHFFNIVLVLYASLLAAYNRAYWVHYKVLHFVWRTEMRIRHIISFKSTPKGAVTFTSGAYFMNQWLTWKLFSKLAWIFPLVLVGSHSVCLPSLPKARQGVQLARYTHFYVVLSLLASHVSC